MSNKSKPKKWKNQVYKLIFFAILGPTLAIGTMLYFYLATEIESRRTLSFLNFEQQAYLAKDSLKEQTGWTTESYLGKRYLKFFQEPRTVVRLDDQGITKILGGLKTEEDKFLKTISPSSGEVLLLKVSGQIIAMRQIPIEQTIKLGNSDLSPGRYIAIWNSNLNFLKKKITSDAQLVYVLNRQASGIFSSASTLTDQDFLKRPLVQDFIKSPLSQAVSGIKETMQGSEYHFYMVIPETNLIFFVESSASHLFAPLLKPTAAALGVLATLLGLILFLWRHISESLKNQTNTLSEALDDFSRGFLLPSHLSEQDFLEELHPLVTSINKNTRGFRERLDLIEKKNG